MGIGVVKLGCVVILKVGAGRQVPRIVTFVGRIGVIRVGMNGRRH